MAKWQRKLDLRDVWETKDVTLIAKAASERLKALAPLGDERLDEDREAIAYDFAVVAADPDDDANDFDEVMYRLYEWADTSLDGQWNSRKVCLVDTGRRRTSR